MFLGEYQHSLDAKGRVVLPSKFRDELEDGCVITKGQDRCLFVFTKDGWDQEMTEVMSLPRTNRRNRNFARTFFAGASDASVDKQGRIPLPTGLREYAGLVKEVTVVGVADRIEIWPTSAWRSMSAEADEIYADIEETIHEEEGI